MVRGRGELGGGRAFLATSNFPLLFPSSSTGVAIIILFFNVICTPRWRHRGSSSYVCNPCTGFSITIDQAYCLKWNIFKTYNSSAGNQHAVFTHKQVDFPSKLICGLLYLAIVWWPGMRMILPPPHVGWHGTAALLFLSHPNRIKRALKK